MDVEEVDLVLFNDFFQLKIMGGMVLGGGVDSDDCDVFFGEVVTPFIESFAL